MSEIISPATVKSNTVSGKILHKESGVGLNNLLVVLFDLDNWQDPEYNASLAGGTAPPPVLTSDDFDINRLYTMGDRIGSQLTDATGSFYIEVLPKDFNLPKTNETKPDLMLLVLTAEEPGLLLKDRLLYFSTDIRFNAGTNEAYLIKFSTELLKQKGIDIPAQSSKGTTNDTLTELERQIQSNKDFAARKQTILKENIIKDQDLQNQKRTTEFIQPFIDKVSKVPQGFRNSNLFVKQTESVADVGFGNIRTTVAGTFGTAAPPDNKQVQGFIYLSPEEINKYQSFLDTSGTLFSLPDDIIKSDILPKIFRNTPNGSGNDFFMDHPTARLCRTVSTGTGSGSGGNDSGNGGNSGSGTIPPTTEADIPVFVAHQMLTATSPEEQLAVGLPLVSLEKRPTNEDIAQNISSTIFQKGPADVPAFYEFHSLKIAFENVWQEAIDQGLIDNAEKWYNQVVANGGDPFGLLLGTVSGYLPPPASKVQPDSGVVLEFPEALSIWNQLSDLERRVLNHLSVIMLSKFHQDNHENFGFSDFRDFLFSGGQNIPILNKEHLINNGAEDVIDLFKQRGRNVIKAAQERIQENQELTDELSSLAEANSLVDQLKAHLNTCYSFKYYSANATERSVNFGLLLTYQQKWDPLNYQVGELVNTIPLAPGENRKYLKKTVVKKHRSKKEQEENLKITKSDTSDMARAEAEIIDKAQTKNTVGASNESKFNMQYGYFSGSNTSDIKLSNEANKDSQQTKKDFHESVVKASQEYKNERKIEITTEETYESEITESGEIKNPNDELTVTYLFYELQRLFKISERLYRLRPVVLVAQEMPAPGDITNEWVISYDWILKRALLDDSFKTGMEYIYTIDGEKLLLAELERTVREQRQILKDLRQNVKYYNDQVGILSRAMQAAINNEANVLGGGKGGLDIPVIGDIVRADGNVIKGVAHLLGIGQDDNSQNNQIEAARVRREAAGDAYQRAEQERKELMARLENENNTLNSLSKELALKRKDIIEKETHIERLLEHFKNYIFYYMQAIWKNEYPDQRFFRLLDTKVPQFNGMYKIRIKVAPEPKALNDYAVPNKTRHAYTLEVDMDVTEVTLKEVADLDNMLGFKGNYMIFPMNQSNILTDFMMTPYIDTEFGLTDPDSLGNWSLDDFEKFVTCLKKQMGDNFSTIEEDLKKLYEQLLQDPLRNGDLLTVPTGSLFIEALPGSHTILEYFKLAHRFEDVKNVQADVRSKELDNIRRAARLVTKKYEDPKTDKKIVVEGDGIDPHINMNDM